MPKKEQFVCSKCGALIDYTDNECPECGAEFQNNIEEIEEQEDEEVFICNICGSEVSIDDDECPGCGATFISEEDEEEEDPDVIYNLKGARGRRMKVYADKVVLNVKVGIGSILTGNATDGEKTIYYSDCIGIQYKKTGLTLGYLQFETASSSMNNKRSNFFNENTFTWETTTISNKEMDEVYKYCKDRVEEYKSGNKSKSKESFSAADEILKYKNLLDDGIISKSEFEKKKKQLLDL